MLVGQPFVVSNLSFWKFLYSTVVGISRESFPPRLSGAFLSPSNLIPPFSFQVENEGAGALQITSFGRKVWRKYAFVHCEHISVMWLWNLHF